MAVSPQTTNTNNRNIASLVALAASGVSATYLVDNSAKFGCALLIEVVYGGTVAATAGVQVDIFGSINGVAVTNPSFTFYPKVGTAGQTVTQYICNLPEGKWFVRATNLDATNALSSFSFTTNTTDAVG